MLGSGKQAAGGGGVTAIVPAYNSARTLDLALDSIEAQTRGVGDAVVVDDASSDDTAQRARARRAGRAPLRVVELEHNAGPAGARNRGAAESRGAWLAFLDADDVWAPWKIERQLAAAAVRPDVDFWCGETVELAAEAESVAWGAAPAAPPAPCLLAIEDFVAGNPVATSTVLMRRELFDRAGGFDVAFRGPEDYDLWMRAVRVGRAAMLREPLAGYRRVPGSLSMDDRRFLPEVLRVLDKAFARGGALEGAGSRRRARGYQFACAAWAAGQAGRRTRAWRLFARALAVCPWPMRLRDESWWRTRLAWNLLRGGC